MVEQRSRMNSGRDLTGQPMKYDVARLALAEARSVDEVATIMDKSAAIQEYARRAKNRQLETDAAEIRMRAERRYGEMLAEVKATVGLNAGTRGQLKKRVPFGGSVPVPPIDERPTLAELGADKKLSARSQKLAAMPKEEFETAIGRWRERVKDETFRITSNLLIVADRAKAAATAKTLEPASGRYGTIVIDPPWPVEKIERVVRPNQALMDYPTMTVPEIERLNVAGMAAQDCHLFCWTTQRFLRETFDIVEGWGFRYVLLMAWRDTGLHLLLRWRATRAFTQARKLLRHDRPRHRRAANRCLRPRAA
jgi:hypothetical protein